MNDYNAISRDYFIAMLNYLLRQRGAKRYFLIRKNRVKSFNI